ncbi:hypothetical protein LTR84_001490 [Exophiala bonariae]|uniref:Matrin-type domain-containing protein n=1 Tax=Exophiala bonariae TaxID=1690606 RepID=A0AAV9NH92_9EURO|nr:hypothetical protein LTR84_001490 [Exophiala bonariae]
MSEYWKSTPKYWCKHCTTYVKDTSFERKQHESTAKHQNNLKRFLRDIQNGHERAERDKQRAKAEVDRLKGTFGSSSELANSPNSAQRSGLAPTKNTGSVRPSAADQKRQWAQLADMGIKIPQQARSEVAMAGDWSAVSNDVTTTDHQQREKPLSVGIKKRKLEGQEEDVTEGGSFTGRGWGNATKRFPARDGTDLDDLLSGPLLNVIKKDKQETQVTSIPRAPENQIEQAAQDRIGTQPVNANQDLASANLECQEIDKATKGEDNLLVKKEETYDALAGSTVDNIPEETPIPVFKRRKAKVS